MDVPTSPRVTIQGGPGWQLDDASSDLIGTEPAPEPRWRLSRAMLVSVAAVALLAFAAGTVLAHWRHDRLGEIAAATLSVSVWSSESGYDQPVAVKDGRASIPIAFQLANTGPRPITLLSVEMPGTGVETGDLGGRRLAAGKQVRLSLLRPLDCRGEPRLIAFSEAGTRLVVRARTDAGQQQVEVRASLNTGLLSREIAVAMCGDLPPEEALIWDVTGRSAVVNGVTVLSLSVENASRHPLAVERVRAIVPWLSARIVDEDGRAVALPVSLPGGDFSTPRQPGPQGSGGLTWRIEIAVPDCRLVPEPILTDFEHQLLEVDLDSAARSGTAQFGGAGHDVMRELARLGCSR